MKARCVVATVSVLAVTLLAAGAVAGQSPKWTPPRTPDGKPDIHGAFTFSTITPLQWPEAVAGKDVLTAEEAAAFEASENKRQNRDLFDPEKGAPSLGYAPRSQGGVLSYNEFWYERGNRMTEDRRTSLITDPPDGRIPFTAAAFEASENKRQNRDLFDPEKGAPSLGYAPRSQGGVLSYNEFWYERGNRMTEDRRTSLISDPPDGRIPFTAATRARNAELSARNNGGFADSYEDRSLIDRCILSFNSGPPMISSTYNNNLQIVQTRDYVVIFNEMIHDARIIPTDGRPHGTLPRWTGDSRGRWEGDTLVVDTINFRRETSLPDILSGARFRDKQEAAK